VYLKCTIGYITVFCRIRNEVDRGYEAIRRIALEALLGEAAAGADSDAVNTTNRSSMYRARSEQQLPRGASLSPQKRGHLRNSSDSPSHTATADNDNDGRSRLETATLLKRQTTAFGVRSLSPVQQAALGLLGAGRLGSDQTAASTLSVVQTAIHRQRMQLSDMKAALDTAREDNASLMKQLESSNNERRRIERDIVQVQEERDET